MTEVYNDAIAYHYAAYRPPIHRMILNKAIANTEKFNYGLDIGCGTGYSSVELSDYCQLVYGLEPSISMLQQAMHKPNIIYINGNSASIPPPIEKIELVTLAGSLNYIDIPSFIDELQKVCEPRASIIVYDFVIILRDIMDYFQLRQEDIPSHYNFKINLDGYERLEKYGECIEQINIELSISQVCHILLADSNIYNLLASKFNTDDPYVDMVRYLEKMMTNIILPVDTYYARYTLTN